MHNLGVPVLRSGWSRRIWTRRATGTSAPPTAGNTDAMYTLGYLHENGCSRPISDTARRWYERAAEAGSSDAMFALSVLFSERIKPRDGRAAGVLVQSAPPMPGTSSPCLISNAPRWLKWFRMVGPLSGPRRSDGWR